MMAEPAIISPLDQTVCVWHRIKTEEKTQYYDIKGRPAYQVWKTLKSETSDELFLFEDETGQCMIDPDDADVIAGYKKRWIQHKLYPAPRRYTEELILENEPLYTIGLFTTIANVIYQQQREDVSH